MARKKNPMELKAAKQKKIAIVGLVLFVVVLGIQVPRTMKMMKGPAAATPVAVTTAATGAEGAPAPAAAPAAAVPGAAAPATATTTAPVELTDSDLAPVAGPGQLVSFELFETKDPFAQQVDPNAASESPGDAPPPSAAPPVNPPGSAKPGASGSDSGSGSGSVVPPGGSPAPTVLPPPTVSPAGTTSISVNGAAEDVQVAGTFPLVDPSFVLVSLGADGRSVKIGVAGGSYADGKSAITLTMGKPLTLQNTASGARYELKLLSVLGSSARPKN